MPERGREVIAHRCLLARRAGVHIGMTLSHARALLMDRDIHVQPFDPMRCQQALEALAYWAMRFTPTVSLDPPDGLLMDITGCTHLWGGPTPLAQSMADQLHRLDIGVRVAITSTFAGAAALARFGPNPITVLPPPNMSGHTHQNTRRALAPLPIAALQLDPKITAALGQLGIERIEQLLDLPRHTLPSRFGNQLLGKLDQMLGNTFQVIEPLRPRQPLVVYRVFEGPTTNTEGIALTVRQLLDELCLHLVQQECAVRRLCIQCDRVDTDPINITVRLSLPSRDAKHLWSLAQARVEKLHMGYGVEQIKIRALHMARRPHTQTECWQRQHLPNDGQLNKSIGQMADAMIQRFGPRHVVRAQIVESHMPQHCVRYRQWLPPEAPPPPESPESPPPPELGKSAEPFGFSKSTKLGKSTGGKSTGGDQARLVNADRPTLLFDSPRPIQVMAMTPQGPPIWLRMEGNEHQISASVGPERITAPWWQSEPQPIDREARDYFKVQDQTGCWLWIYRIVAGGQWFAHGCWA